MHRIEYEIKLNDQGRPCIELPPDYLHNTEDKFFALEMARYFIQMSCNNVKIETIDKDLAETMDVTVRCLGQIGDEVAHILWDLMRNSGDVDMLFDRKYHIVTLTLEDLNKLGQYIAQGNKIYTKVNGLKAVVGEDQELYEFLNGDWIKL
jgi:hypothetical protein